MATRTVTTEPTIGVRSAYLRAAGFTTAAALVAVALVRFAGGLLYELDPTYQPTMWGAVLAVTVVASLAGAGVLWALDRYTANARRNFLVAAAAVVVLMTVPLFATTIPGETTGGLVTAVAMHVVVAGTVVAVLLRRAPTADRTTA